MLDGEVTGFTFVQLSGERVVKLAHLSNPLLLFLGGNLTKAIDWHGLNEFFRHCECGNERGRRGNEINFGMKWTTEIMEIEPMPSSVYSFIFSTEPTLASKIATFGATHVNLGFKIATISPNINPKLPLFAKFGVKIATFCSI